MKEMSQWKRNRTEKLKRINTRENTMRSPAMQRLPQQTGVRHGKMHGTNRR
jgi:hypothetical protein